MDSQLVTDFLAGDRAAVDAVLTWIRLAAWPFRGRFGDDWEDAVADATLQVTESLRRGRFQGRGSLKAYVRRVAVTTCLDRLRARRRWRWTELVEDLVPEAPTSPEDAVEAADLWRLARRILGQVPDDCVRLWRLLMDGRSYSEMAAALEIAAGTLRVRVLRCRRRALEIRRQIECNKIVVQAPE